MHKRIKLLIFRIRVNGINANHPSQNSIKKQTKPPLLSNAHYMTIHKSLLHFKFFDNFKNKYKFFSLYLSINILGLVGCCTEDVIYLEVYLEMFSESEVKDINKKLKL